MLGKMLVNATRNIFHLRHLLKHDFLEFFLRAFLLGRVNCFGMHGVISNSQAPAGSESARWHLVRDSAATSCVAAEIQKE
jgi:hypothetical protein